VARCLGSPFKTRPVDQASRIPSHLAFVPLCCFQVQSMTYAMNTPPVDGAQWTGIVTQVRLLRAPNCNGWM
jgi:hypothetical protein